MLDNQNTIPEWGADTLCRLVMGEADSKRRLYTDDEDVIIELRRAVILNGINLPTDRGDVLASTSRKSTTGASSSRSSTTFGTLRRSCSTLGTL